jgi:hypothetical protein
LRIAVEATCVLGSEGVVGQRRNVFDGDQRLPGWVQEAADVVDLIARYGLCGLWVARHEGCRRRPRELVAERCERKFQPRDVDAGRGTKIGAQQLGSARAVQPEQDIQNVIHCQSVEQPECGREVSNTGNGIGLVERGGDLLLDGGPLNAEDGCSGPIPSGPLQLGNHSCSRLGAPDTRRRHWEMTYRVPIAHGRTAGRSVRLLTLSPLPHALTLRWSDRRNKWLARESGGINCCPSGQLLLP